MNCGCLSVISGSLLSFRMAWKDSSGSLIDTTGKTIVAEFKNIEDPLITLSIPIVHDVTATTNLLLETDLFLTEGKYLSEIHITDAGQTTPSKHTFIELDVKPSLI